MGVIYGHYLITFGALGRITILDFLSGAAAQVYARQAGIETCSPTDWQRFYGQSPASLIA